MNSTSLKAEAFISYDHYNDSGMPPVADDVIAYAEYVKKKKMVLKVSREEEGVVIPGEISGRTYLVPSDDAKLIARSILKAIKRRFKKGYCFGYFDESNLVVNPTGRVKFCHVLRLPYKLEHLVGSYMDAIRIFKRLFSNGGEIPVDIEHLLYLMECYPFEFLDLFDIHASLAPMSVRPSLLKNMCDEFKSGLDPSEQENVLLNLPYVGMWKKRLDGNYLLTQSLNYLTGRYDDPHEGQGLLQLDQNQPGQIHQEPPPHQPGQGNQHLGQHPPDQNNGLQQLSPRQLRIRKGQNYFDYMRNTTTHKMDRSRKNKSHRSKSYNGWKEMMAKLDQARYTSKEFELVTYVRFPLYLVFMQEDLFMLKKLVARVWKPSVGK